ncbi:uncharacterized protein GIQ15_01477 [Arthroderma uncinatum]|uniref:uncharacterized protein n=1 Tax=Arthroderma uncinatum TaxID=74035 RepID=UPI00144AF565|nr:uncharacterized protein GIQ15_01477 [Arthroderma uncinatum]KAF3491960.1 hypothetical protein GIQ15_01477 [Arthroderma uncinatum]
MSRRGRMVDGGEFTVDSQLESTLQQSAAAASTQPSNGHGNRYYGDTNRAVVTGPSKRKSYPLGEEDAQPHSVYRRSEANPNRFSADAAHSYQPHSAQKRVRSNDWSMNGDGEQASNGIAREEEVSEKPSLRSRRGQDVTELRERQERQSRFLEGSMNDRVSTQPPSTFIGDEQEYLLSNYMDERNDVRGRRANGWQSTGHTPVTPTLHGKHGKKASFSSVNTADSDVADSKHSSSVFRFGKAIVSAFNPLGVWGNVSEIWKGQDSSSKGSASMASLADTPQAARIEKAYEEYKASSAYRSHTPTYRYGHSRESTASPTKLPPVQTPQPQSHRPSASIQSSTSKELPPTPLERQHPPSSTKRSSIQTIKNSRSLLNIGQSLRKEQSNKDLAKETKLRRKVSNLEDKLMKYKRELSSLGHESESKEEESERDTNATGPPTASAPSAHDLRYSRMRRKKFIPGALPSLPSERLLFDKEEPDTICELSEQESSPEKPIYTRKSEPRLRRTTPRIGEADVTNTPTATIANQTTDGSTPPSRKRKSPSPDPASIRRRRISTTYSRGIKNSDASSPPRNVRHSTELNGPRPRPRDVRAETEVRRNQPSRRAKENKPEYLSGYETITRPASVPARSESRPKQAQTPAPAPALTRKQALISSPTPITTSDNAGSDASEAVAISTPAPLPIPSSTKPPLASKPKPMPMQVHNADTNANTALIPPPRPASVPTADMISRPGSPKKHSITPRRKANNDKPITVTPGKNGNENIPPVPKLPAEHAGSAAKTNQFEWPDDCF